MNPYAPPREPRKQSEHNSGAFDLIVFFTGLALIVTFPITPCILLAIDETPVRVTSEAAGVAITTNKTHYVFVSALQVPAGLVLMYAGEWICRRTSTSQL